MTATEKLYDKKCGEFNRLEKKYFAMADGEDGKEETWARLYKLRVELDALDDKIFAEFRANQPIYTGMEPEDEEREFAAFNIVCDKLGL